MVKAKLKKEYRAKCRAIAYKDKTQLSAPIHLAITFHPPDKRKRDLDNMLASIKSGLDGIADAIEVDDFHWVLTIKRAEPVKGGAINIKVTQYEPDW